MENKFFQHKEVICNYLIFSSSRVASSRSVSYRRFDSNLSAKSVRYSVTNRSVDPTHGTVFYPECYNK